MLANTTENRALEKSIVTTFNFKLAAKIHKFKSTHKNVINIDEVWKNPAQKYYHQVQTFLWDAYSYFTAILDDPTSYGFTDATGFGADGEFWA